MTQASLARVMMMTSKLFAFLAASVLLIGSTLSVQAQTSDQKPAVYPPLTDGQIASKQQLIASIGVDQSAPRPNIVLLFADDLGYADIGCFGSEAIPTPHIDSLAVDGMRFTNAYVTAATCSPSRAGLMTGRYQQRFGFEFNTGSRAITEREGRGLDPSAVTIADVLRHAGYKTGMVGKWHLGTRAQFHPQQRGFDEFFGFLPGAHTFLDQSKLTAQEKAIQGGAGSSNAIFRGTELVDEHEYLTDAFAREAESFIDNHHSAPFFLYVPFNAVHTPIQATKKYVDRFPDVTNMKQRYYYAMTSAMDDAVGRILDALRRNGLEKKTLVVFLNDNGGPVYTGVQSNGQLRLGKLFLFEGGVRVPMIARWPGVVSKGATNDSTVSTLDLFPTFSRAAGAKLPDGYLLDGVDLTSGLRGSESAGHEVLCWRNGDNKAIRKGKWKLIEVPDHVWLFDLESDVGETANVAEKFPDVVIDLQLEFEQWQKALPRPSWPPRRGVQRVEVDGVSYNINI